MTRRDASADGAFYCAVRTTGVYCRPSCAARPRRENVTFFATAADAEGAGFRPCKRCRPTAIGRRHTEAHLTEIASIDARVGALDWARIATDLDAHGSAVTGALLTPAECRALAASYSSDVLFRSRVIMARHGFGRGEYKYFADPLPPQVAALRDALYTPLVAIANRWNAALGVARRFPEAHRAFLAECHAAGQVKPTPLLLQYGEGDYNCLHQDVYGEHVFPLQVAFLLSRPEKDFTGGEFVLTEQRPRLQSRAEVVSLEQGCGVIFPVRERPVQGTRGVYRVNMRHGVSRLRSGHRQTLGIIFHDAK
ncbi:MAG: 2OG-Fe(II) oxygenase [Xanthobacteraceae bacterium]|nr:2OG-Fe(II) oxygenase [Xanthobacteraceae bacterium]